MSHAELNYDVMRVAHSILADVNGPPMPTRVLAEKVARELGREVDDVAKALLRAAPSEPRATHNGATVMRFGRRMTGWLWHAAPQTEGSLRVNNAQPEMQNVAPPKVETWDVPAGSPPLTNDERTQLVAASMDMTVEEYREWLLK